MRYVRTADGMNVAYGVDGEGPPVVVMPFHNSHVELRWSASVGGGNWPGGISRGIGSLRTTAGGRALDARCRLGTFNSGPEPHRNFLHPPSFPSILTPRPSPEGARLAGRSEVTMKLPIPHPRRKSGLVVGKGAKVSFPAKVRVLRRRHGHYAGSAHPQRRVQGYFGDE